MAPLVCSPVNFYDWWRENAPLLAERLRGGETVRFRPQGRSMEPLVMSGEEVVVSPGHPISVGDIVFCRVGKTYYVHLVKALADEVLIGNNKGRLNGWTSRDNVFGTVVRSEQRWDLQ